MKVLLVKFNKFLTADRKQEVYNEMVRQIKCNAVLALPDCVESWDIIEFDAIPYPESYVGMMCEPLKCKEVE